MDLVEALTYPLPVTIIAEMIGIPAGDRARFKEWSDEAVASLGLAFLGGLDRERFERQHRLLAEMRAYLVPLAEERRRAPRRSSARSSWTRCCASPPPCSSIRAGRPAAWSCAA